MATKGHIAATRDQAINALHTSSKQLAAALDLEPPDLFLFYRDPAYQQAEQLRAIADFNEKVVKALKVHQQHAEADIAALQAELDACQDAKPKATKPKRGS